MNATINLHIEETKTVSTTVRKVNIGYGDYYILAIKEGYCEIVTLFLSPEQLQQLQKDLNEKIGGLEG